MIYVAFGQLAVILVLLYVLRSDREAHNEMMEEASRRSMSERRELLNRIAHPGTTIQSPSVRPLERVPRDPNYGKIGTIAPAKEPA